MSDHIEEIILGINFLSANGIVWNFDTGVVNIQGTEHRLHAQPSLRKSCRRVVLDRDVILPPNSESVVSTRIMFQGPLREEKRSQWVTCINQLSAGVSVAQVIISPRLTEIPVRILNMNSEPVTLTAGEFIADLASVEVYDTRGVVSDVSNQDEAIAKIVANMDDAVSPAERGGFSKLLKECSTVFASNEDEIGRASATRYEIDTDDTYYECEMVVVPEVVGKPVVEQVSELVKPRFVVLESYVRCTWV